MRGSGFVGAPLNFLGDEALVEVVSGDPSRYEDAVADLQARLVHPGHHVISSLSIEHLDPHHCHGNLGTFIVGRTTVPFTRVDPVRLELHLLAFGPFDVRSENMILLITSAVRMMTWV